jgi:hypothetical protein
VDAGVTQRVSSGSLLPLMSAGSAMACRWKKLPISGACVLAAV